jgi:HEAT repeat protein
MMRTALFKTLSFLGVSALIVCICSSVQGRAQELAEDEKIPQWISRLGEGQPGDNNEVTKDLIRIGEEAIPYLLDFLEKGPPHNENRELTSIQWARIRAAYCLSQLDYPKIVEFLLREIQREPHPVVRFMYAKYLRRHNVEKAVEALVDELKRGEYTVPDIVTTLKRIRSPEAISLLRSLLKDSRTDVQLGAAEVLVTWGDTTAESLLLAQLSEEETELQAALILPEKYKDKVIPVLQKYLNHPVAQMRLQVAEKLTELGNADGFEILLDALQKEQEPRRRGGDGRLLGGSGIADWLIALIGSPDTYDPFGTQALRDAVIARWRRRFQAEGQTFLQGLKPHVPLKGRQSVRFDEIVMEKEIEDMKTFFFLSGKKLYEIGAIDGSFPPLGRLLGDQGGIWAHPIKVLDGFEYRINEEGREPWRLTQCQDFRHEFASCNFHFASNGLEVIRRDFVVENLPAMFSTLTIHNLTEEPRFLTVDFWVGFNIRPSWRSQLPNDLDVIKYQDGLIIATDEGMREKWGVVFGSDRQPDAHLISDNQATLSYSTEVLAGGRKTFTFLIVAEHQEGVEKATRDFPRLMERAEARFDEKKTFYRKEILSGVQFQCDDVSINKAFQCAKANLLMMSADFRPYFPNLYFFAGIPAFSQLFGNDVLYSITGATGAGFWEVAQGSLECLAHYTTQQSGRVPHEVCTNGRIDHPGNTQEMPQFVIACGEFFRWTGDKAFLQKVYPLCKQAIQNVLEGFDRDSDFYPEGNAMVEVTGMGPEKIDSACYLYSAFHSLAGMALSLNKPEEAEEYRTLASNLRDNFNRDWWNQQAQIWADSLEVDHSQRMDGYWTVAVPMETEIADAEKASAAFTQIKQKWINPWGFVHTLKPDITNDSPYIFANNLLAVSAYNYGHEELGWTMLKLAARSPLEIEMLGGFDETVPKSANFMQLWSAARFLEAVIEGLMGVRPQADSHRVEVFPHLPDTLSNVHLDNLLVGEHRLSIACQREEGREEITMQHHTGSEKLVCSVKVKAREGQKVTVDGKEIVPEQTMLHGKAIAIIDCHLEPGTSTTILSTY